MDYTQEQLDKMIADAVETTKKGLYTQDDLEKKVTAEVDRRVDSGIQKGIETQKKKWEEEFTKNANLTAEQLAQQKLDEQMALLSGREKEIKQKANLINAKDMLTEADVPKAQYEKMLGMLVSDDEEATTANVNSFIQLFTETKTEIETKVKSEFSKITPPPTGGHDTPVTKESFTKMGYAEKLAFKQSNPEQYNLFIKQ